MLFRIFISILFCTFTGSHAWACSCGTWEGGHVSELSEHRIAIWIVPIKAEVESNSKGLHPLLVSYDLEVIESFGQTKANRLTAKSYGVHSGSCGRQLNIGTPQFLVIYKRPDDNLEVSQCAPELPYDLVKKYFQTGVDTYIPSLDKCLSKEGDVKKDIEACNLWSSSYKNWGTYGHQDSRKYMDIWTKRLEAKPLILKKPWWKF